MEQDTSDYCDSWDEFCELFLISFGIPNEREEAYNQLTVFCQNDLDLSVYFVEFIRLKTLAEISEDQAIHELRRGINLDLLRAVSAMVPPPSSLDQWFSAARDRDLQLREARQFDQHNRVVRKERSPNTSYESFHSSSYYEPQVAAS